MSKKTNTIIIVVAVLAALALSAALFIGIGLLVMRDIGIAVNGDLVAVIYLYGTIQETEGEFMSPAISPAGVARQLERVAADPAIKGAVIRINSPGGSIAASQEIAAMIRDFGKPLVISMADMAASGGYYISAPAMGIVAQPGTLTGSIGVISQVMNLEGLYDKLGIEVETVKSGRHKDMYGRTMTPEERELLQTISDDAHEQFIAEVAAGRDLTLEEVRELATGELFLGSQAYELGLVDRLGGIEEAIAYLAEQAGIQDPVRYEFPPPTIFSQFFGAGLDLPGAIRKLMTTPELLLLERLRQGFPPEVRYQVK